MLINLKYPFKAWLRQSALVVFRAILINSSADPLSFHDDKASKAACLSASLPLLKAAETAANAFLPPKLPNIL
ncbi:hypothetical protein D3C73_983440 [compost metagenome]